MAAESNLTLTDYVAIIRRRWAIPLAVIVLVVIVGLVLSGLRPDSYRAEAAVAVQSTEAQEAIGRGTLGGQVSQRELANEVNFALGTEVRSEVEQLVDEVPDIAVEADAESDLLRFVATAGDPEEAAEAAQVWADAYVSVRRQIAAQSISDATGLLRDELTRIRADRIAIESDVLELRQQVQDATDPAEAERLAQELALLEAEIAPELAALDAEREALVGALAELNVSGQLAAVGTARVVSFATAPTDPIGQSTPAVVVASIAIGLVLGLAAVVVVERHDPKIRQRSQVEQITNMPVVGLVSKAPKKVDVANASRFSTDVAVLESYRALALSLLFTMRDQAEQVIVVVSPRSGDGKSSTASNLAWVLASPERSVALVDLDLLDPSQQVIYGLPRAPGITDFASGLATAHEVQHQVDSRRPELSVVTAGTMIEDRTNFLSSATFADALDALRRENDLVVIDCPPVLGVSDARILASMFPTSLVVCRLGHTSRDQLRETVRELRLAGATPTGVAVIGEPPNSTYGYGSYGEQLDTLQPLPPTEPTPVQASTPTPAPGPINGGSPDPQPSDELETMAASELLADARARVGNLLHMAREHRPAEVDPSAEPTPPPTDPPAGPADAPPDPTAADHEAPTPVGARTAASVDAVELEHGAGPSAVDGDGSGDATASHGSTNGAGSHGSAPPHGDGSEPGDDGSDPEAPPASSRLG